jgi:hypothetical protein
MKSELKYELNSLLLAIAIMWFQVHELASIQPPPPPIRASSSPVQSSPANDLYFPIEMDMLVETTAEDIAEFHRYLRTIPFLYNDLVPSILGRHLTTEADVRT